jgi:hypothetical protein
MTEHNQSFDDLDRHVPDRLRQDLRALFEPPAAVPPQVDRAILGHARRGRAKPRRLIIRLRWAAGIAAAAAVVALGVILYQRPPRPHHQSSITNHPFAADVDGNGRVDILDAFRLARSIQTHGPAAPADSDPAVLRWDLNGDGRVDQGDVDLVAQAAVRLSSQTSDTATLGGDRTPAGAGWAALGRPDNGV